MNNLKKIIMLVALMLIFSATVFADSGLESNDNLFCVSRDNTDSICYIDTSTLIYDSNKNVVKFKYIIDSPKYNQFIVWNYSIFFATNYYQIDSPYIFDYGSEYGVDRGKRASAVEYQPIKEGTMQEHIKIVVSNLIRQNK